MPGRALSEVDDEDLGALQTLAAWRAPVQAGDERFGVAPQDVPDLALREPVADEPLPEAFSAPPPAEEDPRTDWLEIELVDDEGVPLADHICRITLADGAVRSATTDAQGMIRLQGVLPGECAVELLGVSDEDWEEVHARS